MGPEHFFFHGTSGQKVLVFLKKKDGKQYTVRYMSSFFICFQISSKCITLGKKNILLSSFLKWEKQDRKRLSNLPKAREVSIRSKLGFVNLSNTSPMYFSFLKSHGGMWGGGGLQIMELFLCKLLPTCH